MKNRLRPFVPALLAIALLAGHGVIDNAFKEKGDLIAFRASAAFGEIVEVYRNGAISIELECRDDVSGANDQVRLLAATSQDGAFLDGDSNHTGPGNGSDYLNTTTVKDARQIADGLTSVPGQPALEFDIDTAFVSGPNGEYIGIDETLAFGLNVYGADCYVAGVLTAIRSGGTELSPNSQQIPVEINSLTTPTDAGTPGQLDTGDVTEWAFEYEMVDPAGDADISFQVSDTDSTYQFDCATSTCAKSGENYTITLGPATYVSGTDDGLVLADARLTSVSAAMQSTDGRPVDLVNSDTAFAT